MLWSVCLALLFLILPILVKVEMERGKIVDLILEGSNVIVVTKKDVAF
jgi:hypothetical protein